MSHIEAYYMWEQGHGNWVEGCMKAVGAGSWPLVHYRDDSGDEYERFLRPFYKKAPYK